MKSIGKRGGVIAVVAALVGLAVGATAVIIGHDRSTPKTATAVYGGVNRFRTGHTLVIPHGGGDGLFPEDTMVAYTSTMAMGADVVDVDLRLSGDGTLIAFHDPTVDRITGANGNVSSMTYAQLSTLDAGYTFHPADKNDDHPFRGKGVVIPTFESILQRFPHTLLSLDLKDESMSMVQPLCSLLMTYHRSNDVFVGSNSDPLILQFRKACPTVETSAIMADVYADRAARASNDPSFVSAVSVDQPPYKSNGKTLVDAVSLAWSHEHDIAILTWVVNSEADMTTLVGLGVDGIYTSYPDRLLKLLGRCTAAC